LFSSFLIQNGLIQEVAQCMHNIHMKVCVDVVGASERKHKIEKR